MPTYVATPIRYQPPMNISQSDVSDVKRSDGEADSDHLKTKKLSLDEVLDSLYKTPERLRKILLTALFGATLGSFFDLMMGSPIGITSFILRSILKLVPGGWVILGAFDGLGYLLSKTKNILRITNDPGFQAMATQVQNSIPAGTAEKIAKEAERQIGGGQLGPALVALLHAIFLRNR